MLAQWHLMRKLQFGCALSALVCVVPKAHAQGGNHVPSSLSAAASTKAVSKAPIAIHTSVLPPLYFEEDRTQRGQQTFVSRGAGHALLLTQQEAVLALRKKGAGHSGVLRMKLDGANTDAAAAGLDLLPGKIYYASGETKGPLSGNATYRRVKYSGVYPGVDLVYYGTGRQIEFDFVVAPHADPQQIKLSFSGAEAMTLEKNGELSFRLHGEEVRLKKPVMYQEIAGVRMAVTGGYRVSDAKKHDVTFEIEAYDAARPLVIDPTITFATYFGASGHETVKLLRANPAGEVYVMGSSDAPSLLPPSRTFSLEPPQAGFDDCYLAKFAADGSSILYTVVFNGVSCDPGGAMDVGRNFSGQNVVHLAFGKSSNYLRTLTEQGGALFLGLLQGAFDFSNGPVEQMRVDSAGNVYMVATVGNTASPSGFDLRLMKVNDAGQLVGEVTLIQPGIRQTPIPNLIVDQITGLDIDESGSAYVAGFGLTNGIITPTPDALQPTRPSACCDKPFLMRIDTNTPGAFQIAYASYFGGSADDYIRAMAFDRHSNTVVVTGTTTSLDFPTTPGSYWTQFAAGQIHTFVARLDLTQFGAQQLVFSTFLGELGSSPESLAILPGGLPAIAGLATDRNFPPFFPLVNSFYPSNPQFQNRPYVSVLSADGTALPFSSFMDDGNGTFAVRPLLASNNSPNLYAAQITDEDGLGTPGATQPNTGGGADLLIRKLDMTSVLPPNNPPTVSLTDVTVVATSPNGIRFDLECHGPMQCQVTDPDGDPLVNFTWTGPNNYSSTGAGMPPFDRILLPIGAHVFTLEVSDSFGNTGSANVTINVLGINTDIANSGNPITIQNDSDFFNFLHGGLRIPGRVTFAQITSPGLTWMTTRVDQNPPPPMGTGLQIGTPPMYFDIFSSARYTGNVQVCLDIRGMSFANPAGVQIYQWQGAQWTPLPSSPQGTDLCAQAAFLDTSFAIFYPEVPQTAITTIAQMPGTIFGGAIDRNNNFLYFFSGDAAGDGIFRLDLATSVVTRVIGNGAPPFGLDGPGGNLADDPIDGSAPLQYPLTKSSPRALAVDASGNVYFSERMFPFQNTAGWDFCGMVKFDVAANTVTRVAGVAPGPSSCGFSGDLGVATAAQIGGVHTMAFDRFGWLFLNDQDNRRIRMLEPNGFIQTVAGDGGVFFPNGTPREALQASLSLFGAGMAFDNQGDLLLTEPNGLWKISRGSDGLIRGRLGMGEMISPFLQCNLPPFPTFCPVQPFAGDGLNIREAIGFSGSPLMVASDGSILAAQDLRIRRVHPGADGVATGNDPAEIVHTVAGFDYDVTSPIFGGTGNSGSGFFNGDFFATSSTLSFVAGVFENPLGGFLILDSNNKRIRKFGISPFAGGGTPSTADLAILVQDAPDPIDTGNALTYTVTVTNHGPANATGVTMTYTLPSGAHFESVNSGAVSCTAPAVGASSGAVSCDFGGLASGLSNSIFVSVKPQTAGTLSSTFTVAAVEADSNTANSSTTVDTTVNLAPAVINVTENIVVSDAVVVLPSAMIGVVENIAVSDAPRVLPSAMIGVTENIVVSDAPAVTPLDQTPPVVSAPQSITITATEPGGASGNTSPAVAAFLERNNPLGFSVTDNADPNPACQIFVGRTLLSPPNAFVFPVGTTRVSFECSDASGSGGSAGADLTVTPADPNPLVLTLPANQVVEATGPNGAVAIFVATANDAVDGPVAATCAPASGATFPLGATTVHCSATDAAGNSAAGSFSITVGDNTPPSFSIVPSFLTFEATGPGGAVVTYLASASDLVDGPISPVCAPASGSTVPLGFSFISCHATDAAGNGSSAGVGITVVDTTPPTLSLPANITAAAANVSGANVSFTATATDTVSGSLTPACAPSSGSLFPVGATTVNCSAADGAGNSATGSFSVTVTAPPAGTPRITGAIAAKGRDASGNYFVEVRLTNIGTASASAVRITSLTFGTLNGAGAVTLQSPAAPINAGNVAPGQSATVRVLLTVPATVLRFVVRENGALQDPSGATLNFSLGQTVIP